MDRPEPSHGGWGIVPEGYRVELEALRSAIKAVDPMVDNAELVGRALTDASEVEPRVMSGGGGMLTGVAGQLMLTAVQLQAVTSELQRKHDLLSKSLHQFQDALRAAEHHYRDQEDEVHGVMRGFGTELAGGEHRG